MKRINSIICFLLIAMLCMAIPAMAATPNEPVVYDFTEMTTEDLETDDFSNVIIAGGHLQITNNDCISNNPGHVAYTVEAPAGETFTAMDVSIDFTRLANYAGGDLSTDFSVYVKADDGEYQQAYTVNVDSNDAVITNVPVDLTTYVTGATKATIKLEIKLVNINYDFGHAHDWTQIDKLTINHSSAVDTPSQTGDVFVPVCVSLVAAAAGLFVLTLKRKN